MGSDPGRGVDDPGRRAAPDPDRPRGLDLPPRAVHLQPAFLALVAAGGALGTAAREGLTLAVPQVGRFPLAVLVINLVGSLLLGALLDSLARLGPDTGVRRLARLGAGTGFCGGFTTYSALASATAVLLLDGAPWVGALYALVTLVGGAAAAWAGVAIGAALRSGPAR